MDERESASAVDRWLTVAAVVERYQQPLGGYLFHLVGDLDLALAMTEETFMCCRSVLATSGAEDDLRVVLYRAATALALSRARETASTWRVSRRPPHSETLSSRITLELEGAQRGLAQAALRRVPPGERAVLLLCDLELFPLSQAAAILGLSPAAAYGRLAQARAQFRLAYADACRARR